MSTTRWIRRIGGGRSGTRYVHDSGGAVVDPRTLKRIALLRVPPAWRDVHIAADPQRAIQAWGYDARGRKQYRYHARAVERGELRKYHRVRQLAKNLPAIRRVLAHDARRTDHSRDAAAAAALRLITNTFCRVGGERYAVENRTFGVATLRKSHVRLGDRGRSHRLELEYRGKSGVRQRQVVIEPIIVQLIRRHLRTPGPRLFRFQDSTGWHDLTARDINAYLRDRVGSGYSAKDFRTWGGTLKTATVLAELGRWRTATEAKRNVALAMRLVSHELGNTPAICRKSYVHPMVVARYVDDAETIKLPRSRGAARTNGQTHSPEERALIAFLDRHFPERRKRARRQGAGKMDLDRRSAA